MATNESPQVIVGGQPRATRTLISAAAIDERVTALARGIEADSIVDAELVVLICLDGAMIFAADLLRRMERTTRLETVKLKSYAGTQSTGTIAMVSPIPTNMAGRHVLIIEDIVDTGRTLSHLITEVQCQAPASLRTVVLLDKPSARLVPVRADYVGFEVGPSFVVGYGLDIDGRYRNLPHIAEVILD